jgi:hypothetical protein
VAYRWLASHKKAMEEEARIMKNVSQLLRDESDMADST